MSRYDAIVIGGGHNGLTLAMYLRQRGFAVLLLEAQPRCGGMTTTIEPALPRFQHNPHANSFFYLDLMPIARDFDLAAVGLQTIMPDVQQGLPMSDGSFPVLFYRDEMMTRTVSNLSHYSRTDAETYRALRERARRLRPYLAKTMFAAPEQANLTAFLHAVVDNYADLGISTGLGKGTALALIGDLFRSQSIRTAMAAAAVEFGTNIAEPGSDVAFLGSALAMLAQSRLPIGGMRAFSEALARAARVAGVIIATDAKVERVVITDGRATGVVVRGHGTIKSRLVASSADIAQSLGRLVDPSLLSPSMRHAASRLEAQAAPITATTFFCLDKPPVYSSSRDCPDVNRCFRTIIGVDTVEDVLALSRDVADGLLPRPAGSVKVNTLWDASQAPPNRHAAGIDSMFPSHELLSETEWSNISQAYYEAILSRWVDYAPNLRDQVLGGSFITPSNYERKLLLGAGEEQYRTGIEGYYLCGAGVFPGGGVHGGGGFNAYQVIAKDLSRSGQTLAN